ncbi:thymidine phosphorylase [Ahrensia kielensis]|uniref:thymidine phosphorylase n=1 Tax=Ahrensia kielensis TaxID=76980 RepID=UPI0004759750
MLLQEIIAKKRDGLKLSDGDISDFVTAIQNETASDAHIAAFAMAVYFQGMDDEETVALTLAMRDSGDVLSWPTLKRPIADKHSTGGVGDNVSLILAPLASACGLDIPMISGRGLGHTGGTLDKMDSIPGYISEPETAQFLNITRKAGCAIIGASAALAPADKRFYAVRDVTATVENISLITASILSKKLAAGPDWLVLDVKFGDGAFMREQHDARKLAESLVRVGNGAGTKTIALLTDMNEPLASTVGNAVEVKNAIEFLNGTHRDHRLEAVTIALVTQMVFIAGLAKSEEEAEEHVRSALSSNRPAEIFAQMVHGLSGPADIMQNYDEYLPRAAVIRDIPAPENGFIADIKTRSIGVAVVEMGGGRRAGGDKIDYSVGFSRLKKIGDKIEKGQPLCTVHAKSEADADKAQTTILEAYRIDSKVPDSRAIIADLVS